MPRLYSNRSGAQDCTVLEELYHGAEWDRIRALLTRLLSSRGQTDAIALLGELPWKVHKGTNVFKDDFRVLAAMLPVEVYVEFESRQNDPSTKLAASQIAEGLTLITPDEGYVRHVVFELDRDSAPSIVAQPDPRFTTPAVQRALSDAETLIRTSGPLSALDRTHTAFQGYLREASRLAGVEIDQGDGVGALLKKLVRDHPDLQGEGPHQKHVRTILRSSSGAIDALDPLRNRASVAHPNEDLLGEAEAMLAINVCRALLHYLNSTLRVTP